ncbi:hypothetical protein QBC46DRAFT_346226 [Diplogelasinospora grovesii]|uniref:Uncharacterized protein n=1 Tax=Diplogelasinospora grovesii TaxID=303347 RepID=A0AAN6MYG5_9PEZI|nr:hypothetical protein QBC46DRAFT_346226 [Diplogelasinospora grovesii]
MSHLKYCPYPGFGEQKRTQLWYNQAVRVGAIALNVLVRIRGWVPETSITPYEPSP